MSINEAEQNNKVLNELAPEFAKLAQEKADIILDQDRWYVPRLKSLSALNKASRATRESLSEIYGHSFNGLTSSMVLTFLSKLASSEGKSDLAQSFEASANKVMKIEEKLAEHTDGLIEAQSNGAGKTQLYFSTLKSVHKALKAM